eukprot:TRINITY_DN36228_c0_g1_i1.p2 TRINITY_DN36228_c0_g1~~TRINITY_DN36228_c0_g1_i1.p2  ORF type:complete len:120 (+),score=38.13 TRINITY_DN36228_c0_g1_i1:50-409(+)
MFLFVCSALLALSSGTEALSFRQDGNGTGICVGQDDGLHPVPCPWDCSKYYICESGNIALEMDCAPPLHFDPSLEICNWPELVNCEASTTTENPTEEPTDEPTDDPTDDPTTETTYFFM